MPTAAAATGLRITTGSDILDLPAIPVRDRGGEDFKPGLRVLRDIVQRRAKRADLGIDELFAPPELLDEVLQYSGGHIRGLFVLLRSILDRVADLPIPQQLVERVVRRSAAGMALPLRSEDWRLLGDVHVTHQPADQDAEAWNGLLRDRFVLAYQDDRGYWYDWNPLLEFVKPGTHR